MAQIPVLWLCGPPGVGKTAVAWSIHSRLLDAGADPAYVDIDQLGMCYPEQPTDPDRHRLKEDNLRALRANFGEVGRRCLVVSGVVDSAGGPDLDRVGGGAVSVVRLHAGRGQLEERLASRPGASPDVGMVLGEADALDRSTFADWSIDTTGLTVDDVAGRIESHLGDWPAVSPDAPPAGTSGPDPHDTLAGQVLFLFGPSGVGKSTIGFQSYLALLHAGATAAFVDVDQLGFAGESSHDHRLRARNLADLWSNFARAGATTMVTVGPVRSRDDVRAYEQHLPNATFTWRRLAASAETIRSRVLSRAGGGSWAQPGDPLVGRDEAQLLEVAERAIEESRGLETLDVGARIDVDGVAPGDAARLVLDGGSGRSAQPG